MSLIHQARQVYREHGLVFEEDLAAFLHGGGYVVKRPDMLMLYRPTHTRAIEEWIGEEEANAWYVQFAIGRAGLRWFLDQAPRFMPFLVWCRFDGRARVFSTERLRKHI